MLRYGIRIEWTLGISHGVQRDIARHVKRNHERAQSFGTHIMEPSSSRLLPPTRSDFLPTMREAGRRSSIRGTSSTASRICSSTRITGGN